MKSMKKNFKKITYLFILAFVVLISFGFAVDAAESGYIDIVSGTGKDFGDEVKIGDEHFYILSNNTSGIRMLAKYNIDVNVICSNNYQSPNSQSQSTTEWSFEQSCGVRTSSTGLQEASILGIPDPTTGDIIGVPFSTEKKHGTTMLDYEGSVVQIYVNQYVDTINQKYDINVTGDLLDLATFNTYFNSYKSNFAAAPENVNKMINVTFWTKVISEPDANGVQRMVILDAVDHRYYTLDHNLFYGVRPVIIAPASALNAANGDQNPEPDESACYVCGDEYVWTNSPDESSCTLKDNITDENMCVSNPKTGIERKTIVFYIIISIALIALALWNKQNRFKKI